MNIILEIFAIAVLAILVAKIVAAPWSGRILNVLKAWMTVRAFWILLAHQVTMEDGSRVSAGRLVLDTLEQIDAGTFWTFVALAAGIKFVGILASMYRWTILLRGQSIELPFRHIFGSFLIGRFIGTFLPSTAGLDGYKLYDAARFSGKTVEVTATTALEKVIGFSGIFLSFLVALPFGIVIFGENAAVIAGVTVPVCLGLIIGLMFVLFYPGIIQWGLEKFPIPGKAHLEGLVMRVSRASAAYRDKHGLVVNAFALSFVVHFSTAAMYYFTALAIGAAGAEFWPIAFGSSIQILATVLSPFTIAGEGIREAAQYALLGNMIGPANAIVSAALGFWAAEALTLLGGFFWWVRPADYKPSYCLVDGRQVDYEESARAAISIVDEDAGKTAGGGAIPPLFARMRLSAGLGLGAGVLSGLLIGVAEAFAISQGGFGEEAQVLWYGPANYALLLGLMGLVGGAALAILPMDESDIRGWTPTLATLATFIPFSLAIVIFRVRRDLYLEQMPPLGVLAALLGSAGLLAGVLFFLGPRCFRSPMGRAVKPGVALSTLLVVTGLGIFASVAVTEGSATGSVPPTVPAALARHPNLILVMVDTLRADQLSCYGGPVPTPAICSLIDEGGTIFDAYSHASWTKPATASILTSLVPSSHGSMSKTSVLPDGVTMVSEVLKERGYVTGGVVSNINLAPSFGFAQGYDEYHYLGPNYLIGAEESSSKLILYNIFRSIFFKMNRGYRVGDFYQDSGTVNEVAFDFLSEYRVSRFFLFLHYMDPHDPYFAHPYDGSAVARVANQHPNATDAEEMKRLYQGEIAFLDANFQKLLDKLHDYGIYDDTVIALVADHGEEFQEHGGWWHGLTLYDEQIRVPMLIKWAKNRESVAYGRDARGHLARLVDLAPTLVAQAGAVIPDAMQGLDLTQGLAERAEKDRMALAEEDHEGNVLRSIRTRDWKLIEANAGNPRGLPENELFDLSRDADERSSVFDQQRERAATLRAHADAQEQFARANAVSGGEAAQLSDADEDALRALGYIE